MTTKWVIRTVKGHRHRWYDSANNILPILLLMYGLVQMALATDGNAFYPVQAYRGMVIIGLSLVLAVLNALWGIRRAILRDREIIKIEENPS